ncbi:MAG: glycerate kinase, partial [Acidimicrobiales bacterium]
DVTLPFLEAAATFGPQKGASPPTVALLARRLASLAAQYERDSGVDVRALTGAGAAGGLAGGLAVLGAALVPGFEVVAEAIDLPARIEVADLVVTGEGGLDEQSFAGKAVGEVVALARGAGVPVLVVAGQIWPGVAGPAGVTLVSLVDRFGLEVAAGDPATCIEIVVGTALAEARR